MSSNELVLNINWYTESSCRARNSVGSANKNASNNTCCQVTHVNVIYVRETDYVCNRMAKCGNTAVSTPATLSVGLIFETPPKKKIIVTIYVIHVPRSSLMIQNFNPDVLLQDIPFD